MLRSDSRPHPHALASSVTRSRSAAPTPWPRVSSVTNSSEDEAFRPGENQIREVVNRDVAEKSSPLPVRRDEDLMFMAFDSAIER